MIEQGKTYNGRLVTKFLGGWVTYREGNWERECVLTTFIQRHGKTPDKEVKPCENVTPAATES